MIIAWSNFIEEKELLKGIVEIIPFEESTIAMINQNAYLFSSGRK